MKNIYKASLLFLLSVVFIVSYNINLSQMFRNIKIKTKETLLSQRQNSKTCYNSDYKGNSDKLFILGDIGMYNNNLAKIVSIINQKINKQDKIILLGDNFYPNGVDNIYDKSWMYFKSMFKNIPKSNIYTIVGNHDYHKNPKSQVDNNYWNTPNFYYKLNFNKNIDLFFLDTVQLFPEHCGIHKKIIENIHHENTDTLIYKQLNWLQTELQKSNNKKKIVFGHYPIISNGAYSNEMSNLYKLLFPIFKKYNVSAYISGHEHNIQYIKRKENNYTFNQFIIGCSSENRLNEYKKFCFYDMYDNKDNFLLQITDDNNTILNFINKNNKTMYTYKI